MLRDKKQLETIWEEEPCPDAAERLAIAFDMLFADYIEEDQK